MTIDPGQLLWIGFRGASIPPEVRELIARDRVGGVILFARNLTTPEAICALTAELQALSPRTLPIGVDQEGGRVRRLAFCPWPSALSLSEKPESVIEEVGERMGRELAFFGFNVDFAPVLDVLTNTDNRVIGDRAFGRTPEEVIRGAGAWMRGFARTGLSFCGKHFPGHGHTLHDSHLTLPRADRTLAELRSCDLRPFEALAQQLPMMMTAHVLFENLDPERPATLSPHVLGLSREIGFSGVMVSDDLEMGALAGWDPKTLGIRLVEAGAHMGLVCSKPELFMELRGEMMATARRSSDFEERLAKAHAVVSRWREDLPAAGGDFQIAQYTELKDNNIRYLEGLMEGADRHG